MANKLNPTAAAKVALNYFKGDQKKARAFGRVCISTLKNHGVDWLKQFDHAVHPFGPATLTRKEISEVAAQLGLIIEGEKLKFPED